MSRKAWSAPTVNELPVVFTMGGGVWGGDEEAAYNGWHDPSWTREQIYDHIKDYANFFIVPSN